MLYALPGPKFRVARHSPAIGGNFANVASNPKQRARMRLRGMRNRGGTGARWHHGYILAYPLFYSLALTWRHAPNSICGQPRHEPDTPLLGS
jgi:hypothetical protein